MSAQLLDGKSLAADIRAGLQEDIAAVLQARGATPRLAVVTCSQDAAAGAYLRAKLKAAAETGLAAQAYPCAEGPASLLRRLGEDPAVDGIILEQPVPKGGDAAEAFAAIPPAKDVEGVNPLSYGRFFLCKSSAEIAASGVFPPCTVSAMILLLERSRLPAAGKEAVVVGRSEILGRPAAHYLSALDATVTLCHSRTVDLAAHVRRADIVFACLGRAGFIMGGWIKPGAVVVDAGMNRLGEAWVGDVESAAAAERAAFITPVPGGVGPVTTAVVLANTVAAAKRGLRA
ncbi:MAG: bifunctional 5,10-methylenetetrahydrofolate dehydrogenase/5,10-methenyltetrahydrofolate cyclohydrolase [Elusimicrobia bacterium]|nr:bifunctional 5,10-methylenetetrahydrofolate dehydrogenase/5,10-methenyltetrahydrofolate cyclohydrolase [Elusimicrobiota bacterium]